MNRSIQFEIEGIARSNQGLNKLTTRGGRAAMYQAKTIKDKDGKTVPNPAYQWYQRVVEKADQISKTCDMLEGSLKLELEFYKKPTQKMKRDGRDYVRVTNE